MRFSCKFHFAFVESIYNRRRVLLSITHNLYQHKWSKYSQVHLAVAIRQSFLISFWQLCGIFLTTFWWLPFKLANQNGRTGGGWVVKHHVGFPTIGNSTWPDAMRQCSRLWPFWSPWRVEKNSGNWNYYEGRQFGEHSVSKVMWFYKRFHSQK